MYYLTSLAVGKSNILLQFAHKKFKTDHEITIGVEFGAKNITVGSNVFRIQIWDTAGQETFRSITRAYYKNSVCAFLVYDVTNRESFFNIVTWMEECKLQSPKSITMVLIGNKVDLYEQRRVSTEEGKEFADKNGLLFYETSAKSSYNIEEAFKASAEVISKNIDNKKYDLSSDVSNLLIFLYFYINFF